MQPPDTLQDLLADLAHPDARYSVCPLWFWNDQLEPDELVRQLGLMHAQHIQAAVIHPRMGLRTAYLTEDWFACYDVVLQESARLGMRLWIYDEENWPSGYAGGRVIARGGDRLRAQCLGFEQQRITGPARFRVAPQMYGALLMVAARSLAHPETTIELFRAEEGHREEIVWEVPEGDWQIGIWHQEPTNWKAAYGDAWYVDLLNPQVTSLFLEETHEVYFQRFAPYFGSTIAGFFIDEPGFYNNFWDRNPSTVTWTWDFATEFARRRGYDLLPHLFDLWEDGEAAHATTRVDYWQTVGELFQERWMQRIADWCEAHGVSLTGHLNVEEWLYTQVRDSAHPFMALQSLHIPGVDRIDEVYDKVSEKVVSSIAHRYQRRQSLSESFALIGWKLAPSYMKQIVDHQFVRGINLLSAHGFFYSIADERRWDCPPSEFFQNPWWEHSGQLWAYTARLSAVLARGRHVAPVALYYPIDQVWAAMTPDRPPAFPGTTQEPWQLEDPASFVQQTDMRHIALAQTLLHHQYDFDYLDFSAWLAADVVTPAIQSGAESYQVLVVPPVVMVAEGVLRQMMAYLRAGGKVLFVETIPEQEVGQASDSLWFQEWRELRQQLMALTHPTWIAWHAGHVGFVPTGVQATITLLQQMVAPVVSITVHQAERRVVTNHLRRDGPTRAAEMWESSNAVSVLHRADDGWDAYFLVNEADAPLLADVALVVPPHAVVEAWDLATGQRKQLFSSATPEGQRSVSLSFLAHQSHLLVVHTWPDLQAAKQQMPVAPRQILLKDWQVQLGDWQRAGSLISWPALGFSWYSGHGTYTTTFSSAGACPVHLNLGTVLETALVLVNDHPFPPLAFAPYAVDISEAVQEGENRLTVIVTNTNANAFEHIERLSGLLGPVTLTFGE